MDLDISRRAELHAALGDPSRLAIVDALCLSDCSPTELADMLGIGGNLMAHHLSVLEKVEVVRRVVSEGDRRKRYVQLVPAAFSGLDLRGRVRARRVVFVCTENSARSQLAEALWSEICPIKATSAGIAPADQVNRGAVRAAARHGLDLSRSHPKHLPKMSDGDLIISVCDRARDVLVRRKEPRQLHWSVPDPVPSNSSKAFDLAIEVISNRISTLLPWMVEPDEAGAH